MTKRDTGGKVKLIWVIFWALVVVFIIIVGMIFIPPINELLTGEENPTLIGFFVFISAGVVLIGLGVTLIVLTIKTMVGGRLKKFLLLTETSFVGFLLSGILHNVVSGLTNFEEPFFFILATIICPIGFLVGVVGTIVLAIKNKPTVPTGT
jgi:hypothetical protein